MVAEVIAIAVQAGMQVGIPVAVLGTILYFMNRKQEEQTEILKKQDNALLRINHKVNLVGQELRLNRIVMRREHPQTYEIVFGVGNPVRTKQLEETFCNDEDVFSSFTPRTVRCDDDFDEDDQRAYS